jgi:hypothetical protein
MGWSQDTELIIVDLSVPSEFLKTGRARQPQGAARGFSVASLLGRRFDVLLARLRRERFA